MSASRQMAILSGYLERRRKRRAELLCMEQPLACLVRLFLHHPPTRFPDASETKTAFYVRCDDIEHQFECDGEGECRGWIDALESAITTSPEPVPEPSHTPPPKQTQQKKTDPLPTVGDVAGSALSLAELRALAIDDLNPERVLVERPLAKIKRPNVAGVRWSDKVVKWNDVFQRLAVEQTEDENTGVVANSIVGEFSASAAAATRTVVNEYHLAAERRTIACANDDASGRTYMYKNMLLIIPAPPSGGIDESAARKVQSHELKGVKAYIQAVRQRKAGSAVLHTTLSSLVDFKGFRVIVMAVAPISREKTSLVYGAEDGSLEMADERVRSALADAADVLNLKEHLVYLQPSQPVRIHTSADVVARRGEDGRVYLQYLSRVMPPDPAELPAQGGPQLLCNLLRPELVKVSTTPLSSDAFSPVCGNATDRDSNELDVAKTTQYLHEVVIPAFVKKLDTLELLPFDSPSLTHQMHRFGINMRYLRVVAETTTMPHIRHLCEVEMIARTCKAVLGQALCSLICRSEGKPVEDVDAVIKAAVLDFFNLVLGRSFESEQYWSGVLSREILQRFNCRVHYPSLHTPAVFMAMQNQCGAVFVSTDSYSFTSSTPFSSSSLIDIVPRVKFVENEASQAHTQARHLKTLLAEGRLDDALGALHIRLRLHRALNDPLREMLEDDPVGAKAAATLASFETATLLNSLALMYGKAGDGERMVLYARAALGAAPVFHGGSSKIYNTLMESYLARKDEDLCFESYAAAVRVVSWHLGPHHPLLMDVYDTLGQMFYRDGQHAKAVEYYTKSLDLSLKVIGHFHPITARYCTTLGHIYRASHEFDRAADVYSRALSIHSATLGKNASSTAYAHFYLAEALAPRGDLAKALEEALCALSIREKTVGPNDALTFQSHYQVAFVAERLDRFDVAVPSFLALLSNLKRAPADDDSSLREIQVVIKAMVRLKFRTLTPTQGAVLARIRQQNQHFNDQVLLSETIADLYQASPVDYVDGLLERVARLDEEAYVRLACVAQLVEDEEVTLLKDEG